MDSSNKLAVIIIFISALFNLTACSYSFNGASVPPYLKTISIPIIQDKSGSGEFDLGNNLTTLLIQKFIDDNSLRVSDRLNSDSILEGTITSLNDAPAVISNYTQQNTSALGTAAATRRITITVHVIYKDMVKKQTVLENNFTNYSDYNSSGTTDITAGRKTAISKALNLISEDIVLGVVSNW